jgi:hypothetical protein
MTSIDAIDAARSKLKSTTTVVRSFPGTGTTPVATTSPHTTTSSSTSSTGASGATKTSSATTPVAAGAVVGGSGDDVMEYSDDELRTMHHNHFGTNMDAMLTPPPSHGGDNKQSSIIIPTLPLVTQKLTMAQAQAILVLHRNRHVSWTTKPHAWQSMSRETAQQEIDALSTQLQTLINDMPMMAQSYTGCIIDGYHTGAFVKLSCRSAKDVEPDADKRLKLYHEALYTIDNDTGIPQYGDVNDGNARLCALYQAQIHSLRCSCPSNTIIFRRHYASSCMHHIFIGYIQQQKPLIISCVVVVSHLI